MQKLLNIDANAKTVQGQKYGYMTAILYLSPSAKLCPSASKGCLASCLNTAGRGGMNSVQDARRKKTKHFMANPDAFMNQLGIEIVKFTIKAKKKGLIPVVRLNGTSDIDWSEYTIAGQNLFDIFPDVQFYDYTKRIELLDKSKRYSNYHLTFSKSESNKDKAFDALNAGFNVVVVYSKEKYAQIKQEQGWLTDSERFIDGDEHDLRFIDAPNGNTHGRIVMLKAKGKASKDTTGFVTA